MDNLLTTAMLSMIAQVIAIVQLLKNVIPDETEAKFPWFVYPVLTILVGVGLGAIQGNILNGLIAGIAAALGYKGTTISREIISKNI